MAREGPLERQRAGQLAADRGLVGAGPAGLARARHTRRQPQLERHPQPTPMAGPLAGRPTGGQICRARHGVQPGANASTPARPKPGVGELEPARSWCTRGRTPGPWTGPIQHQHHDPSPTSNQPFAMGRSGFANRGQKPAREQPGRSATERVRRCDGAHGARPIATARRPQSRPGPVHPARGQHPQTG
jgi:hypothetical protein